MSALLHQMKSLGAGSKAVALLVGLALCLSIGAVAWVAREPHFELLFGQLDAQESAKVQKALSDADIAFDVSQPPGPFVVYVDRSERHRAFAAVAAAGALAGSPSGISGGDGGIASMFLTAGEREQMMRKRDWQEVELLLEGLEFVSEAEVRTSGGTRSPFGRQEPVKASVALTLRGGRALAREQALTVASLVRNALQVLPADLVIADQSGATLYDGSELSGAWNEAGDWLEHKARFDRELSDRANEILGLILGPNKSRVIVNSEWNYEQESVVAESADPKERVAYSESKVDSSTPQGGSPAVAGGPAGTTSNLAPDSGAAPGAASGAATAPAASSPELVAKTSESSKEFYVPRSTTATVRTAPELRRLSVALYLDQSLEPQRDALEKSIKAAVGFDDARQDQFSTAVLGFPSATEGDPAGAGTVGEGAAAPEESGPSPMLELLLERAVEIVAAIAFVLLALKALKGARGAARAAAAEEALPERDVERLARARVEELVRSEPERVGRILSSWARSERVTSGTKR